jgi:hypothetical protein
VYLLSAQGRGFSVNELAVAYLDFAEKEYNWGPRIAGHRFATREVLAAAHRRALPVPAVGLQGRAKK